MSDLENLTKTLIQIIGSLQNIASKKEPQGTPVPESRVKKTPEMTYDEFIKKAISNRQPLEVKSKSSSYRLQEDLQLYYSLSHYDQISIKTFEQISKSKKINRNTQSLRNRYYDCLYKIDEASMKKIVSWIEKEGIEGYLVFEDDELRIQATDPREIKEKRKRPRPTSLDAEQLKIEKDLKLRKMPPRCQEISEILNLYSKMMNVPVKTLVEKLDQLSGNLIDLDTYIETKDARMLWTFEEDEVLKRGGPDFQILKRYRGSAVDVRKKYLGL